MARSRVEQWGRVKAVERVVARPQRPATPAAARPTTTRRALFRFALASLVVADALGVARAVVSRRAAQTAAIDDARTVTEVLAHSVIRPNLSDGLVRRDPAAIRRMDQAVVGKVTTGSLVRVKLWTPEGKIVYSDEHRLIGASYPLAMDEQEVLRNRTVAVELSDLEAPENRFERDQGGLLEVYLPVWTPGGQTLLFETYSRYSSVTANAGAMWRQFVPITVGALLLLQVLQVPLAWSTARWLDSSLRERERLLRRAVEATDAERRRIARDLHDGVVQDLAAASYSLVGASSQAAAKGHREEADALDGGAQALRRGIRSLRTLLVEIYPPSLHRAGLPAALRDLLDPLAGRGIEVHLDVPDAVELSDEAAELVFRVAQEAVRNVAEHSAAGGVDVRLEAADAAVTLVVADDGIGFDADRLASSPAGGHVGLLLLRDLVATAGGTLEVDSSPGRGTRVTLEVPPA
jgi:two-component system, NarL family, sensor kinase